MHHAAEMHKAGVQHLHVVAGSDRVHEYHSLLHKYNDVAGKHGHYNFKSITVHSSGERDPDSEGTKGVSGTKMREHASSGNKKAFHAGLPSHMKPEHKEALYHDLRHHMGIKEVFNPHLKVSKYQWGEKEGVEKMKKMTPGQNEAKEADYGSDYQNTVKRVGEKAKQGPMKTVWVPAKYGTGGKYKVVPASPVKVKESIEAIPVQYVTQNKVPFLLMTNEQRQAFFEERNQLDFDGTQTTHFDQCPYAFGAFKNMVDVAKLNKLISQPIGAQEPKVDVKTATVSQTKETEDKVKAGAAMKPDRLRHMQFRHYVGL